MTEITKPIERSFTWIDLSTTDAAAAKNFYTKVFGWTTLDRAAEDFTYTMLRKNDKNVAALSEAADQPAHWNCYVLVDDVDKFEAKVEHLGGKVIKTAFDVMDIGRMAVIADPTGGVCLLWHAKKENEFGAQLMHEVGSLAWTELVTNDTAAAKGFYTELFGWTAKNETIGDVDYITFKKDDLEVAGMLKLPESFGAVPSHWLSYIQVADCDAAVKIALELGGKVRLAATDIPKVGRIAVLQDAQGAGFGILQDVK